MRPNPVLIMVREEMTSPCDFSSNFLQKNIVCLRIIGKYRDVNLCLIAFPRLEYFNPSNRFPQILLVFFFFTVKQKHVTHFFHAKCNGAKIYFLLPINYPV